jgi:hypothetical protein
MRVYKVGFPAILLDNESTYFGLLVGYIEALDPEAVVQVTKKLEGINIRISPSQPFFNDRIISGMKKFHNVYNMELEFSKSMKASLTINFNINLEQK